MTDNNAAVDAIVKEIRARSDARDARRIRARMGEATRADRDAERAEGNEIYRVGFGRAFYTETFTDFRDVENVVTFLQNRNIRFVQIEHSTDNGENWTDAPERDTTAADVAHALSGFHQGTATADDVWEAVGDGDLADYL